MRSKRLIAPRVLLLVAASILMMAALPKECYLPGVAPNHMALDAGPQTDGVQVVTDVSGSDPFTVSIAITKVGDVPYYGYQWEVSFPTRGLGYLGHIVENVEGTGLPACGLPQVQPASTTTTRVLGGGCAGGSRGVTSTFQGEFTRFQMQCLDNGSFEISLVGVVDDPYFGTSVYPSRRQESDPEVLLTSTSDVTIQCSGISEPLPPPPPPPPPKPGTSTDPTMIIDADPATAGVQALRDVSGDFSVALLATDAAAANGYQWEIEWDDATLDFVSAAENSSETDAYLCVPATFAWSPDLPAGKERVGNGAGCLRSAGTLPPDVKLTTIALHCRVDDGRVTSIHIVSGNNALSEDTIWGSLFIAPGGATLDTSYVDAEVRCGAAPP